MIRTVYFHFSGSYASCGFQVRVQRKQMQFVVQVYLPSFMFVIVSWVSFLVKPEVVPGRWEPRSRENYFTRYLDNISAMALTNKL